MGSEFAQLREWDEKREQDWELLDFPVHKAFSDYMRDLCTLCARRKALYAADYDSASFEWIDPDRDDRCVFVYRRKVPGESTVVMLNFSDKEQKVKAPGELKELLCTDDARYGGAQKRKASSKTVILAPYSGKIFEEI
jgi:1,4-alpha-glucan branching enzyme